MEEWRNIEGYDDYQVSNYGRVRSLKFGKERIMKMIKHPDGYLVVSLCKDGKTKVHLVHRLVARAFIDNPDNLPIINHKDENKTNNHVDNLEWCTAAYNLNYNNGQKRRATKHSKTVYQYTLNGEFIKEWPSVKEIYKQLGYTNISSCCLGKLKTAYGYIWKYAS